MDVMESLEIWWELNTPLVRCMFAGLTLTRLTADHQSFDTVNYWFIYYSVALIISLRQPLSECTNPVPR